MDLLIVFSLMRLSVDRDVVATIEFPFSAHWVGVLIVPVTSQVRPNAEVSIEVTTLRLDLIQFAFRTEGQTLIQLDCVDATEAFIFIRRCCCNNPRRLSRTFARTGNTLWYSVDAFTLVPFLKYRSRGYADKFEIPGLPIIRCPERLDM